MGAVQKPALVSVMDVYCELFNNLSTGGDKCSIFVLKSNCDYFLGLNVRYTLRDTD